MYLFLSKQKKPQKTPKTLIIICINMNIHQFYIQFISVVERLENDYSFDLEYAPIFYITIKAS